jgi:opacity protein-like surface antigen
VIHRSALALVLWMLFLGAVPLAAQTSSAGISENPRVEVSVGYSYVRARTVIPTGCCFNMNGGSASGAFNVNSWLGIAGDFGGYYTGNVRNSGFSLEVFSYTFGPRISIRRRRVTPFAQALFGGGHAGDTLYTVGFQQGSAPPTARNSFAMVLGGGLDVNVSRHIAIRAAQADWLYTQFPNGVDNRQNNLRITAGIVFRFGG